jgi:hypothetical protein
MWFITDRNRLFAFFLPKDGELVKLCEISAEDIIRNFGPVKRCINTIPPKTGEAYWATYRPFGVFTNQISYPNLPFFFLLNEDDTLNSLTVSILNIE